MSMHMIVDFTSIKAKLGKAINQRLRAKVKENAPFLHSLNTRLFHEGHKALYETVDHKKGEVQFREVSSAFQVKDEEIRTLTIETIIARVDGAALDMAGQMERGAFSDIEKTIQESGNNIPGNPPISPDAILLGLEAVYVDFDRTRDKPILPSLIMHPQALEKLREEDAKMTPEARAAFEKRQQEILDKKYNEYVERESKRKLID